MSRNKTLEIKTENFLHMERSKYIKYPTIYTTRKLVGIKMLENKIKIQVGNIV